MKVSPTIVAILAVATSASHAQNYRRLPPPSTTAVSEHGSTVAALPDINGDGIADIAIGGGGSESGNSHRVFVYSGLNGALLRVLYTPHAEFNGMFGNSISAVPDTNGDGVADIAVGAPNHSPGSHPDQCGRVYLYSGADGSLLHKMIPAFPVQYGQFGYSVAGIPDVNNDGRGDVVIGAPYERSRSNGSWFSGRVHIYSGATGTRIRTLHSVGEAHDGHFGEAVAVIPDVDNDGRADILIGSPKERPDRSGRVYIYNHMGGIVRKINPPYLNVDGRFGDAVAAVPDTDGDGVSDIVIGAPRQFSRQGRAFLYSGATGQLRFTFLSPSNQNDGRFGKSVAGMPDFNGDGRGEVIVGAYHEQHGGDRTGRAYVFSGATGALAAFVVTNSGDSEELGHSVAGLPDTNGNGKGEVAAGAPDHSSGHSPVGMAYHFRY